MNIKEILGKYVRLRAELAAAKKRDIVNLRHGTRLAEDIAELRRTLSSVSASDEQFHDTLPGIQYFISGK